MKTAPINRLASSISSPLIVSNPILFALAKALKQVLDHPLAPVRKWTVRRLADDHRMSAELQSRLVRLAAEDPDVRVRAQLCGGHTENGGEDLADFVARSAGVRERDFAVSRRREDGRHGRGAGCADGSDDGGEGLAPRE